MVPKIAEGSTLVLSEPCWKSKIQKHFWAPKQAQQVKYPFTQEKIGNLPDWRQSGGERVGWRGIDRACGGRWGEHSFYGSTSKQWKGSREGAG